MSLNLDVIGRPIRSQPFPYGPDQVILYALGIGAGPEELAFIYEKGLKVYPTFAVLAFIPILFGPFKDHANLNIAGLLHAEQKIILHKPIPPAATLESTLFCESIYDKGDGGALINLRVESRTDQGDLLFENLVKVFDRTAGHFGGERGPESERHDPPPNQPPDFRITQNTTATQAALYRLTGDKNPLHIDPVFARKVGFNRIILHGLCTFGFTGRAVLKALCGDDPGRLKSLSGRFLRPVFPGDALITEGWRVNPGQYILRTINQDGIIVLGNAVAEIRTAEEIDYMFSNEPLNCFKNLIDGKGVPDDL
jgi:acyl dehydratase